MNRLDELDEILAAHDRQYAPNETAPSDPVIVNETEQKLLKWAYETALEAVSEDEETPFTVIAYEMAKNNEKTAKNHLRIQIRQALRIKFNQE